MINIKQIRHLSIIVVVLVISLSIEASGMRYYRIVLPSGASRTLDSRKVNGIDYTTMRQLSSLIAAGGRFVPEAFTLESRGMSLKTLPGSFFILLEIDDSVKIAQMLLPALLSKRDILLPVQTFFQSLETLGLYQVDIAGNTIRLRSDKYEPVPERQAPRRESKPRRIREESEPDLDRITSGAGRSRDAEDDSRIHRSNVPGKTTQSEEQSSESGAFREARKPSPPNKYEIPENLKREDVEKEHKKKH